MYTRTNKKVFFVWPALAFGIDLDGRMFFEAAWGFWAVGLCE